MRLLSLDIGDKRTGIASGDAESGIVSPIGVVEAALRYERRKTDGAWRFSFDADALTAGFRSTVAT